MTLIGQTTRQVQGKLQTRTHQRRRLNLLAIVRIKYIKWHFKSGILYLFDLK